MQIPTYFSEVQDFRVQGRCHHQLGDILGLLLCGTLADCDDFSEMEDYGNDNLNFLKEELGFGFTNGVPSEDTLDRARYGQTNKVMQIATGTALWYKSNDPLVPLRWVLIKDPTGHIASTALLCTDQEMDEQSIINFFIRRWTQEAAAAAVTFEEFRRHLEVESQRQWSDLAIARTTPLLMGLFSINAMDT